MNELVIALITVCDGGRKSRVEGAQLPEGAVNWDRWAYSVQLFHRAERADSFHPVL